jgi:hypothetical protein
MDKVEFLEPKQFLNGFLGRDSHLGKAACSWDAIP